MLHHNMETVGILFYSDPCRISRSPALKPMIGFGV